MAVPSTNGRNGSGQFATGNKHGKGNPLFGKVATLRSAVLKSVTPATVKGLVKSLIDQAMAGDIAAAKLILPYLIGQPATAKELETEADSEPIAMDRMTDEELQAHIQGIYKPGRDHVFNVIDVVETVVSSRN
ncbi:MAG: hypothetical protein NTV50_04395 [Planctomycetota bacterium]|nr:hypothetical protein [Planctomycetota bacterium]